MSAHERPSAHRPLDDHVLVTLTLHALHRPPDDLVFVTSVTPVHRPPDDHVLVTLTLHPLHRPPDDHVLVCGGLSQAVNSALQIRIHTPQVHVVVLCGLMPKRNSIQLDEWEEKLSPLLQHDEEHVRSRRRRTL